MSDPEILNERDGEGKDALIRLLGAIMPAVLAMTDSQDRAAVVEFGSLLDRAAQGERLAGDRIKNPWGTSETPKSALARARLRRGEARDNILKHLTPLIAAFYVLAEADEITRSYELSKQRPISDDAGQRFLDLLGNSGVTDRTMSRTSSDTIARIADLLNDQVAPAAAVDVDLLASLKRYRLLDLVCRTDRGDWKYWMDPTSEAGQEERGNRLRFGDGFCHIPRQVALDTARPPRGHARWQRRRMHEFMWDEWGASPLFRVFVRSDEDRDGPQQSEPIVELPPFATVAEMAEHNKRFAAAYTKELQNYRELDAHRTLNKYNANLRSIEPLGHYQHEENSHDIVFADPDAYFGTLTTTAAEEMDDSGYAREDEEYSITQRLINFSGAQANVILSDVQWAAWKDWGILLATIDAFNGAREGDVAPWQYHQNLVWLYFLKGRLCKSDAALPPQFREVLFDWLELPVTFAEEACTRYLVPVRALDGALGDDGATNMQRRAWARHKRIR